MVEIMQDSLSWPDTTKWPVGQQEEARRFKAEWCDLLAAHLTLIERTRGMAFTDAYAQLEILGEKSRLLIKKYHDVFKRFSKAEIGAYWKQYQALENATLAGLYVDRKQWVNAAAASIHDWNKASYYLRKDVIKGRCVLVLWSFQRRIHPEYFK